MTRVTLTTPWVLAGLPSKCMDPEFAFAPQTAGSDGDFVQGILTRGQYEIIET